MLGSQLENQLSRDEAALFQETLGDERLLNREEAAKYLGVSLRTIDAWTRNQSGRRRKLTRDVKKDQKKQLKEKLVFMKLGHKVFFELGDLRKFRQERKVSVEVTK